MDVNLYMSEHSDKYGTAIKQITWFWWPSSQNAALCFQSIVSACTSFLLLGEKNGSNFILNLQKYLPFYCYTYYHTFENTRIIDNRVLIMLNITIHQMSYMHFISTGTILFVINGYTNYMQFWDYIWASLVCLRECKFV